MNQETFVLTLNVPFVQVLWAQPGVSDLKVVFLRNWNHTFWFQDLSHHNMKSILWYMEGKNSAIQIYSNGSSVFVCNKYVSHNCVTLHKISASKERLDQFFGITDQTLIFGNMVRRVCFEFKQSPPHGIRFSKEDVKHDIENITKRILTSSLVENGLSAERYRWIECGCLPCGENPFEKETDWFLMQINSPQHSNANLYDITVSDKLIIVDHIKGWELLQAHEKIWFIPENTDVQEDVQDLDLRQISIPLNVTVHEIDASFHTLLNLFFLNRPNTLNYPELSSPPILNPNWYEVVERWTQSEIDLDLTDW